MGEELRPSPAATPLVVVIATYQRRAILDRALAALAAQTRRDFRIVVVDDGSTDGSSELLAARAAEARAGGGIAIDALRQENAGQGRARNLALSRVSEESSIVLFLGDDAIAHPGLVAEHHAAREGASGARSVVGFIDWCRVGMKVTPALEMVNREGHQFGYAHMRDGAEVPFTCFYTSNVSVPRRELGVDPFDPSFHGYGWEDVELGYRLEQRGVRLHYHRAAVVEHLHPMTLADLFRRQREVGAGLPTLLALHPGLTGSPLLSPLEPPGWFPLGKRLLPALVPLLSALDARSLPLGRRLLHRILICGYYLGLERSRAGLSA